MMDLRVVESGLVPVYEDAESRQVVNARELHAFLGVGKDFSNWIKDRIEKYGFEEDVDFCFLEPGNGGALSGSSGVCSPNLASKNGIKDGRGGHNVKTYLLTETGPDIPPAVSTKMPAMNNATLIASAPRMLEVLEWLSDEYCCRDDSCGVLFTEQDFRRVHAVIREARAK